ncbi:MAG: tyrosine recombinase XerC [Oscillospiraceae bacterium]
MANIQTIGKGASKKYKLTWELNSTDGKRHRKSKTFPAGVSKSTVLSFKRKVEEDYALGELGLIENKTMNELVDIYLRDYSKFVSPTTLEGYKAMIYCKKDNKGIIYYFDNVLLRKINTQKVQEYVTFLIDTGIKSKSVRNYINLLNVLFTIAEDLGFIRHNSNPCKKVKLPKKEITTNTDVFTADEIRYLLDFAEQDNNETALLIITLGALCGLRRGEMCGLKWENVQLDGFAEIRITETVVEVDGVTYVKPPKTKSGIRTIPIGENVVEILRKARNNYEMRKEKYGDNFIDSGYVLNHEKTGINLQPEAVNSRYLRFMRKQNKVPYRNLHNLRHTFASLLAANGVSPKAMQNLLGHSDCYTSIQIYTSVYRDDLRDDTNRIDSAIFKNHTNNDEEKTG